VLFVCVPIRADIPARHPSLITLVINVIDRVLALRVAWTLVKGKMKNQILECQRFAFGEGQYLPVFTSWQWLERRAGKIDLFINDAFASSTRREKAMYLKHILASSIAAVAVSLAGVALAESPADATAKAASEMATDANVGAAAAQEAANVAVEGAADVSAAQAAGMATSTDAEAADLAAEGASEMAADMMEAKEATEAAAKEAKTDAVLEDSKKLIEDE